MKGLKTKIILGLMFSFALCRVYGVENDTLKKLRVSSLSAEEIDQLLKRVKGQMAFANAEEQARFALASARGGLESASPMMAMSAAPEGGEKREQQESDIYKLGPDGSKILYYLNGYRGLQTISFKAGIEKPELLSRASPTGNNPNNMYIDLKNNRLVVIETVYVDSNGQYQYNDPGSRLLSYDISNPESPKLTEVLNFAGQIADSRLVGDILYVATSETPSYYMNSGESQPSPKGKVFSFSLGKEIQQVNEHALALPASRRENMGIVEVEKDGRFQYYLVAVLSESGYGWGDRNSLVEVVNISDPKGQIAPSMYVSAKGFINQRSWTTIQDGYLIVTSNYTTGPNRWSGKQRVAVESFRLPTADDKPLSYLQAQYRLAGITAKLENLTGDAKDEAALSLSSDAELGLKGHFFLDKDGKVQKLVPDSVKTVGDTTGQSANLQSVRYVAKLVYAAWVPANEVDPIDLLDISNPTDIKFVNRLQFEGWIQRKDPISYKGRNFVLGLGYIVPIEDNEKNRRFPQAMLFEIVGKGKKAKTKVLAQKTLTGFYADLSSQDKFFDLRFSGDGKGSILFQVQSASAGWKQGGKLIGFDLEQALVEEPDSDAVFQEGGLLAGSSGWLKRVFRNPELDRVQTLSDKALGTFGAITGNIGNATQVESAAHILELARNIRGFEVISEGEKSLGIQIVSDYDWYGSSDAQSTSLRLVPLDKADAELSASLASLTLSGSYVAHHKTSDGKGFVILTEIRDKKTWQPTYELTRFAFKDGGLSSSGSVKWTAPEHERRTYRGLDSLGLENIQEVSPGLLLVSGQGSVKEIQLDETLSATDVGLDIGVGRDYTTRIVRLNEQLFVLTAESIGKKGDLGVTKKFMAPLIRESAGKWIVGDKVNIPGDPIALLPSGVLITEDSILKDSHSYKVKMDEREYDQTKTVFERTLIALDAPTNLLTAAWRITDLYPLNSSVSGEWKQAGDRLIRIETGDTPSYARPFRGGRGLGFFPGNFGGEESSVANLRMLGVDKNSSFVPDLKIVRGLSLPGSPRIMEIFRDSQKPGTVSAIFTSGTKAQIVSWVDGTDPVPQIEQVIPLDEALNRLPKADIFSLLGQRWGGYGDNMSFDATTGSLVLPSGLSGACQVFLERLTPQK